MRKLIQSVIALGAVASLASCTLAYDYSDYKVRGRPSGIELSGSTETGQYGNTDYDGQQHQDRCPPGQAVIGYEGKLGKDNIHRQIRAVCGALSLVEEDPLEVLVEEGMKLPLRGSEGDVSWSLKCSANQVVVGFAGRYAGAFDQLTLFCAPLCVEGNVGSYALSVGFVAEQGPVGHDGGSHFGPVNCPAEQVATTSSFLIATGLAALGLSCSTPQFTYP